MNTYLVENSPCINLALGYALPDMKPLTKPQLAKVTKAYLEMDALIEALRSNSDPDSACASELLVRSRNSLGELLRWQDFQNFSKLSK